ncbi:MAG: hypothetical protein R6T99_08875 [Bacteroidales bacterium]
MKKVMIAMMIVLMGLFMGAQDGNAVNIIKLGKGGATVTPGGQVKLCPQFSFRKCCKITVSWSDIWSWITNDGCWDPDVNTNMPLPGNAVVYNEEGTKTEEYQVTITWINPVSCAEINGNEMTVEHQDILVEVVN